MRRIRASLLLLLSLATVSTAAAEGSQPFSLRMQGLRTVGHEGGFKAAAYRADGTPVLLYDQGDGLRLIATDAGASSILAEAHLGAAGDTGVAVAVDASGNIYVGGTSSSGSLAGTPGAAFTAPVDTSVNSFVARFDTNLHLTFLTFLGAPNTALTGVAVTGDAVFATGVTYSPALPTTPGAALPVPAPVAAGNGFVERLTTDGTTLVYATYLTGSGGSTTPAAITADAQDDAYVAGSTSSPSYPSVAALQPTMLGASAGFVSKLTAAGNAFAFSTFVAGAGLTSMALDASTGNLLLTGNLSLGQFPVSNVAAPVADTPYQGILRLSGDGGRLVDSALLLPGTRSAVVAGPNGTAWVTGSLSAPANAEQADAGVGDGYLLHLTGADEIDAMYRFGGHPANAPGYASLRSRTGPPVVSADGLTVLVPSTITAATDPSFAMSQAFDLGLATIGNSLLPSAVNDLLPAGCTPGLPCSGTGGLLAMFGAGSGGESLLLSGGGLPTLTVRNPGPGAITGLQLTASGFALSKNCTATLGPGELCGGFLTGSGPGSVVASAASGTPVSIPIATPLPTSPESLVLNVSELNFGIVTASSPVTRSFTVTNLGAAAQTFSSAPEAVPSAAPYTLSEASTTCAGPPTAHTLAPNSSCTVAVALAASYSPGNDSAVQAAWAIGQHSVPVLGFTQAASLAVSASTLDFGASLGTSTTRLPRFLYLSNASSLPFAHAPVASPPDQPFTINDDCPTTLQPNSVCQIELLYTQTNAPAIDTLTLDLDEGLAVLVTGETLAASPPAPPLADPPLSVSPASVHFFASVPVSGVSTEVQVVQITNTSGADLPLSSSVLGDFLLQNTCPATLPAQASCDLGLQLAPSQPGLREGLLTLSAGNAYRVMTVPISGNGEPLLDLSSQLDLGETPTGEPVTSWFQLGNTLPAVSLAVSGAGFGVAMLPDDGSGHGTLSAGGFGATASGPCSRCWIGVQFLPSVPGAARGTLQVSTASGGNPYVVALGGTGVPAQGLLLTPAVGSFGALPVGSSSAPLTFTLTNALANALPVDVQQVTATGDFRVLRSADPHACTGTLAPTAACSVQVAFNPTQGGSRSGTLTVVTGAGMATVALGGTGTAPVGLAISPTALTFAQGTVQTITLTNTGSSAVTVLPPTVSGSAFSVTSTCGPLGAGGSCTATVSFQPASFPTTGTVSVPVSRTDEAGESTTDVYAVPLDGAGTLANSGLLLFPAGADFGTGATGALGEVRQFSLTNTSSAPVQVSLEASRNFPLATPVACDTLAAGASCTFSVVFLPETAGPLSGTVVATATGADMSSAGLVLAYLRGYGSNAGGLQASDGAETDLPLNFGTIASGQTAAQRITLSNSGNAPITIRRLSTTAPFVAAGDCLATLPAGASCAVDLTYAPVYQVQASATLAPRADRGTLTVESDAATSAETVYLSGTVRPSVASVTSATAVAGAIPAYTLSQSALTFPNTQPGARSVSETVTLSNNGFAPVVFDQIVAPPGFAASTDCSVLQPGTKCSVQTAFTPAAGSSPSLQAQTLEIVSNAAAALESVSLLGSSFAAPLQVTPAAPDFGSVLVGVTAQMTFTLTNVSTLPISLGGIMTGDDYAIIAGTCPAAGGALPIGQSCTFAVGFTPTATGMRSGTLTVASPGLPAPLTVPLTGTGIAGHLQVTPASLDFGTVDLNTQSTLTLHLGNTGTAGLTGIVASLSGPDAAVFTVNASCNGALPVGAGCDLEVGFNPTQSGADAATLTLTSSDPASTLLLSLAGTGAQPPGFVLTVDGGSASTATIHSGGAAVFPLLVTPQGGYASPVALACIPVHPAPNATCSLSGTPVAVAGGPGAGTATISTLAGLAPASTLPWSPLLLVPGLVGLWRGRRNRPLALVLVAVSTLGLAISCTLGCGGNAGVVGYPYTPPGTYVYQVTASSTAGAALTSTVTLTVTVQ